MTRLVSLFFAGIAFILVVYWVLPGVNPPQMTAVKPAATATTVQVAEPAKPAPSAVVAPAPVASPPAPSKLADAPPPAPASVARAQSACDADPIKCLLEGGHPTDPAETTGSISRALEPALHPTPRPAAKAH